MADTLNTTTTDMLHRYLVTVELDVALAPDVVIFPGSGSGDEADLPIMGVDELEDQLRLVIDQWAATHQGYSFRVHARATGDQFPVLNLDSEF